MELRLYLYPIRKQVERSGSRKTFAGFDIMSMGWITVVNSNAYNEKVFPKQFLSLTVLTVNDLLQ